MGFMEVFQVAGVSLEQLTERLQLSVPTDMSKTHPGKTRGSRLTEALVFLASLHAGPLRSSQILSAILIYAKSLNVQAQEHYLQKIQSLLCTSPYFHFFPKCWFENEVVYILSA